MKRPLAAAGITCLAVQLLVLSTGLTVSVILLCLAVVGIISSFLILSNEHRRRILPVLVSVVLASGVFTVYEAVLVRPAQRLAGQEIFIEGTIAVQPYEEYDRCYYIIDTDYVSVGSAPQRMRVRISSSYLAEADVTDRFSSEVTISQPNGKERFSGTMNRLSRGIVLTGYLKSGCEPDISLGSHGFKYKLEMARKSMLKRIDLLLPNELSGLLKGILLGNKRDIDEQIISDFRVCGLSHLLAVSGLHMAVIVFALSAMLRNFGLRYRAVAAVTLAVLWLYIALTGFSYSVMRAGIMTSMLLVGRLVKREADSLNSLGAALLIICCWRPYAAADVGLLMSASATLGLIVISPRVNNRINKFSSKVKGIKGEIVKGILHSLTTTVIASLSTLPVVMLYLGECSLIAPAANLLCVQASTIFMLSGAVAVLISYVPFIGMFLARIIIALTWFFGRLILLITHCLAALPKVHVNINFSFAGVFLAGAAVILLLWYVLYGRGKNRRRSLIYCLCMLVAFFFISATAERIIFANDCFVKIYSVGEGITIALNNGKSSAIIGTGGDEYDSKLMTYDLMDSNRTNAEAVFYADDTDYYSSNIGDFIKTNSPKRIFMPPLSDVNDSMAYAVSDYVGALYNVSGASFKTNYGELSVEVFSDENGQNWFYAQTGEISVLICPEGGDCSLLPQKMTYPDCAVVRSDNIVNIHRLSAGAFIVSADVESCGDSVALLRYKGAENVYSTENGDLVISEYSSGIRIGDR